MADDLPNEEEAHEDVLTDDYEARLDELESDVEALERTKAVDNNKNREEGGA